MSSEQLLPANKLAPFKRQYLIMTVLAISILVGFYLCQDQPQALQVQFKSPPFDLTGSQFNFIYFSSNIPNVIFPVLSGMLIDKIGVRKAGLIFGFGVFLAQLAVTATIYWRSDLMEETDRSTTWYYMLLLSRAVFGVCGENIHIVQAAMISIVIPTERLSLVLGLCMSVPLMFTSLNSLISTWVYDTTKQMALPFLIGTCATFFSFLCIIAATFYFTKITKKVEEFVENQQGQVQGEKIDFSQIKNLGLTFWLLVSIGFVMPGIWYGFLDNVVECIHQRFKISEVTVGKIVMIPYIVCSLSCPFYGWISNKFLNKRKLLIFLVPVIAAIANILIFLVPNTQEATTSTYILISLGLAILGFAFSGYVSIVVPSVSFVVEENILGTAFGVISTFNAISQAIFPVISSIIISHFSEPPGGEDESQGYKINSLFFVMICLIAICTGFWLLLERNKKARELDNLEEFEEWDGDINDQEIDELFPGEMDLALAKINQVKESQESEIIMKEEE